MLVEDLDMQSLWENAEAWEASEEQKKKVSEDGKKAQKVRKQMIDNQVKSKEFAFLLSKILWRYYDDPFIINYIHNFLLDIEKYQKMLYYIFIPFLEWEKKFEKVNDYVEYIKKNIKSNLKMENLELIIYIIELEKIWWDTFWLNLKNKESKYKIFLEEIKNQLLN